MALTQLAEVYNVCTWKYYVHDRDHVVLKTFDLVCCNTFTVSAESGMCWGSFCLAWEELMKYLQWQKRIRRHMYSGNSVII